MNYRHDLRLVRMNLEDDTLHCEVHGLLPVDETQDVFERSGLTTAAIKVGNDYGGWRKAFYEIVAWFSRPKCEPVQ